MQVPPLQTVRYDAMVHAIAERRRIDEAKDLRDKAVALEVYARQAQNVEAERKASEVRLRAERRAGELLKGLARATPADDEPDSAGSERRAAHGRRGPVAMGASARL